MNNKDGLIKVNGVLIPSSEEKNLPLWKIALGEITKKKEIFEILSGLADENIKTRNMHKGYLDDRQNYIQKNNLSEEIAKNISINSDGTSSLKEEMAKRLIENMKDNYINGILKNQKSKSIKGDDIIYNVHTYDNGLGYRTSGILNISNNLKKDKELWNKLSSQLSSPKIEAGRVNEVFDFVRHIDEDKEYVSQIMLAIIMNILIIEGENIHSIDIEGKRKYLKSLPITYTNRDSGESFSTIISNYDDIFSKIDLKEEFELAFVKTLIFYINHMENISEYIKNDWCSPAGSYLNSSWMGYAMGMCSNMLRNGIIDERLLTMTNKLGITKEGFAEEPVDNIPEIRDDMTKEEKRDAMNIYKEYCRSYNKRLEKIIPVIKENVKKHNLYDDSKYANIIK